jgi:pyridoxal phosphate enzyme (YggS family)
LSISDNLKMVMEKVAEAALRSGRKPEDIKIVVVSKTHPIVNIEEAYDSGIRTFGENRVQEAAAKIPLLPKDIEWHLIGHLQTNKTMSAVQNFNVIQSIDSIKLAAKLERDCAGLGKIINVMIQLDLAAEETKFGIPREEFYSLCNYILESSSHLNLIGLMCLPPYFTDSEKTRPYFEALREYFNNFNNKYSKKIKELSMGMSNDYEVAIEEGATIVRIGTAIFGDRSN